MGLVLSRFMRTPSAKKQTRILILGLDGVGKTTILHQLKLGEVVTTTPATGFTVETVEYKNVIFIAWDVGGPDKIRPLWRQYYQNAEGLVFVVDSIDRERISKARDELHRLLSEDELRNVALVVFANKHDLPNAMGVSEITDKLGLHTLQQGRWYIHSSCATKDKGLFEGMDWLSSIIASKA
ncbi:hypothetical protein BT93_H2530 [Corymbia citriodora subsp. variegata]|nr:hypothetical protein BT93_H2530 [Corymbia citriodora subsp. variegata]KAF8017363.1 hypothetical protein BT93_H2530 [Corymbia citriodora subsp. variegata]KAF8017364.1 hypothetical protein BT93_H2530 [Corymbia citriodora subsp. variegata]